MIRRRVVVRGRVQGVGFRWFVRERARALGLAGWVRNLDDGLVEFEVEGEAAALAELMGYVGKGPKGASVVSLEGLDSRDPESILPFPFVIER